MTAAVWGAVTGTVAWRENRQITVNITAATYNAINAIPNLPVVGTDQLRVSLVNTSARAISISDVSVVLDGAKVGRVVSATQQAAAPGEAAATPTALPVTVPADSSSNLLMDWRASPAPADERRLFAALRRPLAQRRFTLHFRLEPGGAKTVRLSLGEQPPIIAGWTTAIRLHRRRVTHILVMAAARSTGVAEATLKLWRPDPATRQPFRTLVHPVGWALPGWFSVAGLRSGTYVYTISTPETVVAGGTFTSRCDGSDGMYQVAACTFGRALPQSELRLLAKFRPPR